MTNRFADTVILIVVSSLVFGCAFLQSSYIDTDVLNFSDLLVGNDSFPDGWSIDPEGPRSPGDAPFGGDSSIAEIEIHFFSDSGFSFEQIHKFEEIDIAKREYDRQVPKWFPEDQYWGPWEIPIGFDFQSTFADNYRFGCSPNGSNVNCHFLSRYGVYLIGFVISMISPVDHEVIEEILRDIDSRMLLYLE